MTFEYRDPDGEKLVVQPHERKKDGQQVVELYPASLGYQAAVHIPLDRVEEVVAGIRDAARTASGQQPKHRIVPVCDQCSAPWATGHTCTDPTTADDPTPLRWGLGGVLHGDDDTVTVCLSGPDREPYWLELEPEEAAVLREDLAAPNTTSVVGQPAEAQATDRTALRERVRLAAAQWHLDDSGSGRTVHDLDDAEFGTLADAVLSVLTVEDETR